MVAKRLRVRRSHAQYTMLATAATSHSGWARADAAITTSFFVPPSTLRAANPGPRFSQGGPANPPQAKPRSLLQRLLGGDLEAGSYSTGENSLPLREVAKFKFPDGVKKEDAVFLVRVYAA